MSGIPGVRTIQLSGSYAIDRASDLARQLGDELAKARDVDIDLTAVQEFDLAVLQVLYAAANSAVARGGSLRLTGIASESLCKCLVSSGFSRQGPLGGADFSLALPDFKGARQ